MTLFHEVSEKIHIHKRSGTIDESEKKHTMHSEKVDPNQTPKNVKECKPQDAEDRSCKLNELSEARGESTEGESDGILTLVSPCVERQPGSADAFIEVSENDETSPMHVAALSDTSHIPTPGAVAQRRQATRLAFPQRYDQETDSAHLSSYGTC